MAPAAVATEPALPEAAAAVVLPALASNQFSLPRKSISSKTGQTTVTVKIPGPGKVELIGTAKSGGKAAGLHEEGQVGQVVLTADKAGTFKLTLKPSGAAKQLLRKKGKLKVSAEADLHAERRYREQHHQRGDAEAQQRKK